MCVRVCCKELQLCVQELNVDGFKHFGMHEGDASKLISAKLQKHKNQGVLKCNYPFVCVCVCACACACSGWCDTFMDEHRLRVLVDRMLMKIGGPKMEEVRSDRRLEKMTE